MASVIEDRWMGLVKTHGCLCCHLLGYLHDPDGPMVEAHHLLSGGLRRGHLWTVGLCQWHHRGRQYLTDSIGRYLPLAWHRDALGPALSEGSEPFEKRWGDDEELMSIQRDILQAYGISTEEFDDARKA